MVGVKKLNLLIVVIYITACTTLISAKFGEASNTKEDITSTTMDYLIQSYNMTYVPGICYMSNAYVSNDTTTDLPERYGKVNVTRRFSSNTFFLYNQTDQVLWHTLKADETWHHYYGSTMVIYIIDQENGTITTKKVGNKINDPEAEFQVTVPHGSLFSARVQDQKGFSFGSAQVTPGFEMVDSKFFEKKEIEEKYPKAKDLLL
jgi:predicted cupin superfamily sugar epimerase